MNYISINIFITFYLSVRAIMPVRHKLFLCTDGRVEKAGQLTQQSSIKNCSVGSSRTELMPEHHGGLACCRTKNLLRCSMESARDKNTP